MAMLSISDPTLTTDSVAEVMELINDWKSLDSNYYTETVVPDSQLGEIQQRCSTKRHIAHECASYYIHCHPQPSLTRLASHLYNKGEFAAVEKFKPFLPLRGKCQGISILKYKPCAHTYYLRQGVVTTIPVVLTPMTGYFDPVYLCIL